jgi:peptide/nickel transport system permease protein
VGYARFVLRRLLQSLPTFALITVLIFLLVRLLPGDPASAMLGDRATDEAVARINAALGTDLPIWQQFLRFLHRLVLGDFGQSQVLHVPVTELIGERMPVTLMLAAYAMVLSTVIAVPLAFLMALHRGRPLDIALRGVFQLALSMPTFYLGLLLLTVLGAHLHIFPVGGLGRGPLGILHHLFLPALTLALGLAAIVTRSLRASILEVLDADFIDFARAKGLSERVVLGRHVLRNALISTVTLFGINLGQLMGGAVITETVFSLPGVGRMLIDAIYGRDYPVIEGLTMCFAVLVSLIFIATDLFQAWLDPRVYQ